jgi:glycosyltransferase involved in cell wall biosynthesis
MSADRPVISVIIPIYNAERYLPEAIKSVFAQTYQSVEVILSNDGSTDGSAEIAARYCPPAHYHSQANGGPAAALNQGIRAARGTYLSFLSADDIWVQAKLDWQMQALSEHPDCDMVFGHMQHFLSSEIDETVKQTLHCPPDPMPAYAAGTMLISLAAFLRVGFFDTRVRAGEFLDWYARSTDLGLKSWLLPDVLSMRRVHGANHTVRTVAAVPQNYTAVLKACLDRRRRMGNK